MKLPSGREVSNQTLADIIDYIVLDALSQESFSDAWNNLANDLEAWDEDGEVFSSEDALAIAKEVRETAGTFWLRVTEEFGRLHVEHVHSKYPHEG